MKPLPLRKGDGSPNLTAIVRVLTAELEKLAPDDQLPERSLRGLRVALGLETMDGAKIEKSQDSQETANAQESKDDGAGVGP